MTRRRRSDYLYAFGLVVMLTSVQATAVASASSEESRPFIPARQAGLSDRPGTGGVHCVTGRSALVHALGRVDADTTVRVSFNTQFRDIIARLVIVENGGSSSASRVFLVTSDDDSGSARLVVHLPERADLILVVNRDGTIQTGHSVCYNFRMDFHPPSQF